MNTILTKGYSLPYTLQHKFTIGDTVYTPDGRDGTVFNVGILLSKEGVSTNYRVTDPYTNRHNLIAEKHLLTKEEYYAIHSHR